MSQLLLRSLPGLFTAGNRRAALTLPRLLLLARHLFFIKKHIDVTVLPRQILIRVMLILGNRSEIHFYALIAWFVVLVLQLEVVLLGFGIGVRRAALIYQRVIL